MLYWLRWRSKAMPLKWLPAPWKATEATDDHQLHRNWRNWMVLIGFTVEAVMCAAPLFHADVPWLHVIPVKAIARAASLSGLNHFFTWILVFVFFGAIVIYTSLMSWVRAFLLFLCFNPSLHPFYCSPLPPPFTHPSVPLPGVDVQAQGWHHQGRPANHARPITHGIRPQIPQPGLPVPLLHPARPRQGDVAEARVPRRQARVVGRSGVPGPQSRGTRRRGNLAAVSRVFVPAQESPQAVGVVPAALHRRPVAVRRGVVAACPHAHR